MNLHDRFAKVHEFPGVSEDNLHPKDFYLKKLVSSLYTVGRVSNTPKPIPLPDWDDDADLINILDALHTLSLDILGMLKNHNS